jgi:hypothetical protein
LKDLAAGSPQQEAHRAEGSPLAAYLGCTYANVRTEITPCTAANRGSRGSCCRRMLSPAFPVSSHRSQRLAVPGLPPVPRRAAPAWRADRRSTGRWALNDVGKAMKQSYVRQGPAIMFNQNGTDAEKAINRWWKQHHGLDAARLINGNGRSPCGKSPPVPSSRHRRLAACCPAHPGTSQSFGAIFFDR